MGATPKKVQFVAEDDSDHDLFENMNGEQFSINALNDVLKVATKHNKMNENVDKEEEREKDAEEIQNVQSVTKVPVGATWAKIKSEVKNSNEGQNKKNRDKKQHKKNVVVAEKIENESEKKQNENNENKQKRKSDEMKQDKMTENEKVNESEKSSVASPSKLSKLPPIKQKKKRKKRKKKKVQTIMNGIDNGSEDDTVTIESSSTAPSSTQYQEDADDSGWITKGSKVGVIVIPNKAITAIIKIKKRATIPNKIMLHRLLLQNRVRPPNNHLHIMIQSMLPTMPISSKQKKKNHKRVQNKEKIISKSIKRERISNTKNHNQKNQNLPIISIYKIVAIGINEKSEEEIEERE